MKIICGLGNPDNKYQNNKHNIGFIVLDAIAKADGFAFDYKQKFNAEISKVGEVLYVKPLNYMNRSGEVLSKIVNYYNVEPKDILVIHDDIDLEFGKNKLNFDAGSAGHNGVINIFEHLGETEIWRLRVGVGKSTNLTQSVEDWVLTDISAEQIDKTLASKDISSKIEEFLEK